MASRYHEVYESWKKDPLSFWGEAAKEIDWIKPPKTVFDPQAGVYGHWFPDGTLNTCYNALDRHVINGRADQAALIYDSPVTGLKRTYTYAQLLAEVNAVASVLKDFGVVKGDRVLVYMPMIAEAVIGVLACARIGAVHSVVFGGFAAKELATRIDDSQPKVIIDRILRHRDQPHRQIQAACSTRRSNLRLSSRKRCCCSSARRNRPA